MNERSMESDELQRFIRILDEEKSSILTKQSQNKLRKYNLQRNVLLFPLKL
jgi:hypothetical protein